MDKPKEVSISVEDRNLIFKGIRPDGMNYEVFKRVRKDLNKALNRYKGGRFKHISINTDPMFSSKIESKGTYTKE